MISWEWVILIAFWAGVFGVMLGERVEAAAWRSRARRESMTARYSAGEFYYVMPEDEYCNRVLNVQVPKRAKREGSVS